MSRQEIYSSLNDRSRMRPSSAELADLHVYIVPPELWRERYNNLLNQNVTETISAGIIRVHPDTRVCNLRDELETQLGAELLPRDYIFLKSVGRSITRLKPKQEFQLKVKHFLPPNSYAPELYLLEVENREDIENDTVGSTRPTTRSPQFTESEDERQSNRYNRQKPRNATSPYRYTSPLPKIKSERGSQKTVDTVPHFNQNGDVDGEHRLNDSWSGDQRKSPRHSPRRHHSPPQTRRSPPPRSPPPQNDHPSQSHEYPVTSRLNDSPTNSGDKQGTHQQGTGKYDPRSATYTNQTNDSGIAGLTPEEYRENYDDAERRKNDYNDSRQKELENRLNGDEDESERQRRLREDREREEWERKRKDEDDRRRREEDERRRREEEERQREEDERRRREEEREKMAREKLSGSDEGGRGNQTGPIDPDWTRQGVHREQNQNQTKLYHSESRQNITDSPDEKFTQDALRPDPVQYEVDDQDIEDQNIQEQSKNRSNLSHDTLPVIQVELADRAQQGENFSAQGDIVVSMKPRHGSPVRGNKANDYYSVPRDGSPVRGNKADDYYSGPKDGSLVRGNKANDYYSDPRDESQVKGNKADDNNSRDNHADRPYSKDTSEYHISMSRDNTNRNEHYSSQRSRESDRFDQQKTARYENHPTQRPNQQEYGETGQKNVGQGRPDYGLYDQQRLKHENENTRNQYENNSFTRQSSSQRLRYKADTGESSPQHYRNKNDSQHQKSHYYKNENQYSTDDINNREDSESQMYRPTKVSKTFVKEDIERRMQQSRGLKSESSRGPLSEQTDRRRGYPRQETEDSVLPHSPPSDSEQQYVMRIVSGTKRPYQSEPVSKARNAHKSSFPSQHIGGRPVIHHRKDLNRFPSPPPMNVASSMQDVDAASSRNLTKEERQAETSEPVKEKTKPEIETKPVKEKTVVKKKTSFKTKSSQKKKNPEDEKRLLQELEAAREARRAVERQREELVKKAKLMQNKTQNRRNHARDLWKKRYFEEKKRTPPLEEQCNKLRHELDVIHRKLMNALEGSSKDKNTRIENLKPSKQNNYKIQATRLTHEIDDLRRRLENAKMKLTAEMKLRNQAETELRALRAELTQKKIHLTLARNQQMTVTPGGDTSRMYRTPALSHKA